MRRQEVIDQLAKHRDEIMRQFGLRRLAIFGSIARDEAREGSDIDVLIEYESSPTFKGYMDLKFYLEDLFGAPVDLVTEYSLREAFRPYIERDLIEIT